jgi:hypothetical protein
VQRLIEEIFLVRSRLRRKVHLHETLAAFYRQFEPQQLGNLRVAIAPLPIRISSGCEVGPPDGSGPDLNVVEPRIKLIRLRSDPLESTAQTVLFRPHLEQVFAIDRKEMAECDAAARSEWKIVAEAYRLIPVVRYKNGLRRRNPSRPTQRHLSDFRRGAKVSLGLRRRQRQRVGVVVKSMPGGVGGQQ